jgi:hypothetical protein
MSISYGLEVFNLSDGLFTTPSAGKLSPMQRRNHTAELLGSQIFIFGGINNSNDILNDSFLLNLNPLKWTTCIINKFTPGPKVFGHSSCVVIPREIIKNHKFYNITSSKCTNSYKGITSTSTIRHEDNN